MTIGIGGVCLAFVILYVLDAFLGDTYFSNAGGE